MFDIGFLELLLVAVIGLIVLGPERLPKAAHSVGMMIGRIRRSMSQAQMALDREVRLQELKEKMENPYATFTEEGRTHTEESRTQSPGQTSMPSVDTEISEDVGLSDTPSARNSSTADTPGGAQQAGHAMPDAAKIPEKPQ